MIESVVLPELLRYAVSRKMFCACGSVLDVSRAVMVEWDDTPRVVSCGDCFHNAVVSLADKVQGDPTATVDHMQVLDGRTGADRYRPIADYFPAQSAPVVADPDQLSLTL